MATNSPNAIAAVHFAKPRTPHPKTPVADPRPNPPPGAQPPPRQLPPWIDRKHLRAVEKEARRELARIDKEEKDHASLCYPSNPKFSRTENNKRSSTRCRMASKRATERIMKLVDQKAARNLELQREVEEWTEKVRRQQQEIEEWEKLPDAEPDRNRIKEVAPEQFVMHNFLVKMDDNRGFLPDADIDVHLDNLAYKIIDKDSLGETADPEISSSPNFGPPSSLGGLRMSDEINDCIMLDACDERLE